jgi:hypothetical protein
LSVRSKESQGRGYRNLPPFRCTSASLRQDHAQDPVVARLGADPAVPVARRLREQLAEYFPALERTLDVGESIRVWRTRIEARDAATIGRIARMISLTSVAHVPTFVQYNAQTEALISYMLERLDEDDALAGAMRYPNLIRAVSLVRPLRDNINDYRRAVHRWADSDGDKARKFWELMARYETF